MLCSTAVHSLPSHDCACGLLVSPDAPEPKEEEERVPRNARQVWTDDDLAILAKYIKKFPGGTADR